MLRVLLISPLPKIDPACGDVIYTHTLLSNPPDGVVYETYADAIARGALIEHGTGRALKRAWIEKTKIVREACLCAAAKLIQQLRSWRVLFWEPFRFFSVRSGEYDLIHLHVFSARFLNLPCPLIVSNACPVRDLYTDARDYSRLRTGMMEAAERLLGRLMGVNVNSYSLPQAKRVIAFTEHLKRWYVGRQIAAIQHVDIVPIFLPTAARASTSVRPRRVGFIAKDFVAKGGPTLLRAFAHVRERHPDAELFIVGCPPRLGEAEAATLGIRWLPYVERPVLLSEILPSFDVFAYPTEFDGMPLVVLEAMSCGIPIAASNYRAIPEMLGAAGLTSPVGDAEALAANIFQLLDPIPNAQHRRAGLEWFSKTFSSDAVRPKLRRSYEMAVHG